MRLPVAWNRSRATAVSVTLVLHAVMVWWLLALRFELPDALVEDLRLRLAARPGGRTAAAVDAWPPTCRRPKSRRSARRRCRCRCRRSHQRAPPDWSGTARDVAKGMTTAPGYQPFRRDAEGAARAAEGAVPAVDLAEAPAAGRQDGRHAGRGDHHLGLGLLLRVDLVAEHHAEGNPRRRARASAPASWPSSGTRRRRGATCSTRSSGRRHRKNRVATRTASANPVADELPAPRTRTRTVREALRPR